MNTIKGIRKQEIATVEGIGHHIGEVIEICGSIYKIRKMKGFSFVPLRMRRDIVQCVLTEELVLHEESTVKAKALVVAEERSRTGFSCGEA